jgi:hypothetical protein
MSGLTNRNLILELQGQGLIGFNGSISPKEKRELGGREREREKERERERERGREDINMNKNELCSTSSS